MEPPPPPLPESLLGHAEWLRALARTLVVDDDRADEVVQQAWLSALQSPPRHGGASRRWWSRVLHHTAADLGRRDRTRRRREQAAARPEATASAAETVERVSLHRAVVGAVLELDEPSRSTILLRYFDGLSPARIARRQGVSVNTVQSRLQRGLARLRQRLDREWGDEGRWHRALLVLLPAELRPTPSALTTGATTTLLPGALLMSTPAKFTLALVLGVAVLWWVAPRLSELASSSEDRAPSSRPSEIATGRSEPDRPTASEVERRPEASPPADPGTPPPASLRGTVRLHDAGIRSDDASGSLQLHLVRDERLHSLAVDVVGGRWSAPLVDHDRLLVSEATLDGRRAYTRGVEPQRRPDGQVEVHVFVPARRRLEVVDARSGEQLDGVQLCLPRFGSVGPWRLRDADRVVEDARSPLELSLRSVAADGPDWQTHWRARYYVRAAGYAWQSVVIDFQGEDGSDRVPLFPGGALDVEVVGLWRARAAAAELEPVLRLYDPEDAVGYPMVESVATEGLQRIEGLPPGDFELRLELGPAFGHEQACLARARCEVRVDETPRILLPVEELSTPPQPSRITGSLRLGAEALDHVRSIQIEPLEHPFDRGVREQLLPSERRAGQAMPWSFDVWCGRYRVSLPELGHGRVVEVGPEGARLDLDLAAFTEVELRLEDAVSGKELRLPYGLYWHVASAEPARPVRVHADDGRFRFLAPTGPIVVEFSSEGHQSLREEHELAPRRHEITLRLRRSTGLVLVCEHDGARIDLPWDGDAVRLSAVGHDGLPAGSSVTRGEQTHFVSQPGRYLLELSGVLGYAPRRVELELEEGVLLPVHLELEPER